MTIKAKLIGNVLVIAAIIVGISQSSYVSMSYLQKKILYLTETSSPYQIKTVELQLNLQKCLTDLISVNAATDLNEFVTFRAKALQSLSEVKNCQTELQNMNPTAGQFAVYENLEGIAQELISSTEAKIQSDMAAYEANTKMSQQMKMSTAKLKDLETSIRTLQHSYTDSFAQALKSTERNSANLRNLEELKNLLKELLAVSGSSLYAKNSTAFLITKGKIKTLMGRIARNKSETYISSKFKVLEDDVQEFLNLGSTAFSRNDAEAKRWALESFNELTEYINRMNLELNQEIELASSRLSIETQRQGHMYDRSNDANSILLANSELVALGLTVTGETNRLFTITSPEELDSVTSSILATFSKIHDHAQYIERSLNKLQAKDVLHVLDNAHSSLELIRSELTSAHGIVNKLKTKMAAIKQADSSAEKLHAITARQSAKGKVNISVAQEEQKKAIRDVNRVIYKGMSQLIAIGTVAVLCGILFGIWIYRSVLLPLRTVLGSVRNQQHQVQEKAVLVEAVAGGDLNREVTISQPVNLEKAVIPNDEIGMVLRAVTAMSQAQVTLDRAFADMTMSLRSNKQEDDRRNRINSGLFDLNIILRDEQDETTLAEKALAFIADFVSARIGILYRFDSPHGKLHAIASFSVSNAARKQAVFNLGEGLVGQAARERKCINISSAPPDYLAVTSTLGSADPINIIVLPILFNDVLIGVVELGTFTPFSDDDDEFLHKALEGIAIALNILHARQQVNNLLIQTQQQAEELLQTNEELEERTRLSNEQQRNQRAAVIPA